ncbi:hypothetical protein GCM10022198_05130 [Klugiella xanthotipulae]|uniref:Uncharacterized protein DUF4233 n=1 Tax=Klugiella xanthotipulae TaxID=244735 RepID=A0A543HSC7_9MICO|nr:DUF4233 domain-containing protein [Klugiella xanthotipulae]TQM61232.1 uncharacterized protein DUF4233 [Klugiella xanthotipulae]
MSSAAQEPPISQPEVTPLGPPRSVKRSLASIVLGFELVIVFLAGLLLFGLNAVEPRELGLWGGVGMCLVMIIAMALLTYPIGFWIGWAVQCVIILTGILVPVMFIVGALFTALWVYCMITGDKIDARNRAAYQALADR